MIGRDNQLFTLTEHKQKYIVSTYKITRILELSKMFLFVSIDCIEIMYKSHFSDIVFFYVMCIIRS